MSSKANELKPITMEVYGYEQGCSFPSNSPMSSALCRQQKKDKKQTKMNSILSPLEGFTNFFHQNMFGSVEGNTTMKESKKENKIQIPSFKPSSRTPYGSDASFKQANEIYLKHVQDSKYDTDVIYEKSGDHNTLIQK